MKKKIVFISIIIAIIAIASVFLYNTYATDPVSSNDSYVVTLSGDTTVTLAANEKKNFIYQIKNTNNGTVKYGLGYSSTTGNSVVKIWNDSTDPATGTIATNNYKYIKIRVINYSNIQDTVTLSTLLGYENGGELIIPSGTIQASEIYVPPIPLAQYITDLYNNGEKNIVTNNSIEYNYVISEHLMNDRLGGTTADYNAGNIRYYGASDSINNYVWFGEYKSEEHATANRKLYRIIGVFDGKVKLIQNDSIGTYSWDTSDSTKNSGNGINQWGESTYSDTGNEYKGADLMKLLNPGFDNNQDLDNSGNTITVNNSLYWNHGSGNCYNGYRNSTISCDFTYTGLSDNVKNKIKTATWYLGGGSTDNIFSNEAYVMERGNTLLNNPSDKVVRVETSTGKVGLIYPSDYGYATDLTACSQTLNSYNNSANSFACRNNNWLFKNSSKQLISPSTSGDYYVWLMSTTGSISRGGYARNTAGVFPTFYLNSDVAFEPGGTGTSGNPYVIVD